MDRLDDLIDSAADAAVVATRDIGARFHTVIEDQPGAVWQAHFQALWPGYRSWFLRSAGVARPGFLESRRALRDHMPELVPTWTRLVELAGGGDVEARFLSMWCPPAYIGGCSQAVWLPPPGSADGFADGLSNEPALIRNYDFAPLLLEASWMATRWTGGRVVALGDCLWGALDGINDAGLCAALSFGGRQVSGTGFGIPLVLRYVLEVAHSTADAVKLLQRVPVSMCYSVTLLDAGGDWATVFVSPDRTTEVTRMRAVTNVQHQVEWPAHAHATQAVARAERLNAQVESGAPLADAVQALLQPPLLQSAYLRGHGTLYTAVYQPLSRRIELLWPGHRWPQTVPDFAAGEHAVRYVRAGQSESAPAV
ncbi:MAG: C45 family peptidase [Rubrivivax sp.]